MWVILSAGKAVAKFCAKYLHQQVLKHEAYSAGEIGTSVQKSFLRFLYWIYLHQFFGLQYLEDVIAQARGD